jgi:hypothetical protein
MVLIPDRIGPAPRQCGACFGFSHPGESLNRVNTLYS